MESQGDTVTEPRGAVQSAVAREKGQGAGPRGQRSELDSGQESLRVSLSFRQS